MDFNLCFIHLDVWLLRCQSVGPLLTVMRRHRWWLLLQIEAVLFTTESVYLVACLPISQSDVMGGLFTRACRSKDNMCRGKQMHSVCILSGSFLWRHTSSQVWLLVRLFSKYRDRNLCTTFIVLADSSLMTPSHKSFFTKQNILNVTILKQQQSISFHRLNIFFRDTS